MGNGPTTVENGQAGCVNPANGGINHIDSTPHACGNAANQAGSSFSLLPPATTFEEQLVKMERRGLIVNDRSFAISKLRDLNYYRLRGYWLTLEDNGNFIKGTSFDDVWEIYQLDRDLRRWLWRAMAPIEITMLYGNLDRNAGVDGNGVALDEAIAKAFGAKPWHLRSLAHHLTTVRNIAAHHDRFYNRMMNIRPSMLRRDSRYVSNKQFPTFIIRRIYEKSWPGDWKTLGAELASCFDQHASVNLAPMGMPNDWRRVLELS